MRQLRHPRGPSLAQPRPGTIPKGAVCLPSHQGHGSHSFMPVIGCLGSGLQTCTQLFLYSLICMSTY